MVGRNVLVLVPCSLDMRRMAKRHVCGPGVIQCTEKDEFAYQEMIAHLPLCGLAVSSVKQCCQVRINTGSKRNSVPITFQQAWTSSVTASCLAGSAQKGIGCWWW